MLQKIAAEHLKGRRLLVGTTQFNAQRDPIDYKLVYIPVDFILKAESPYDKAYMQKLFERGYTLGRSGYPWQHYPPGLQP